MTKMRPMDRRSQPFHGPTPLVMVKGAYDRAGGPETVLQTIVRHLDRERFPPLLALLASAAQPLPPVLGDLVTRVPSAVLPWRGLGGAPGSALQLARLLDERPGAILHTNDMRADLLAWMITRVRRVPWIAHVHGWLRHTHSGRHKLYEDIDRFLIRGADLVLVGSSAMAEEVRLAGGRRVEIVSNGIAAADPAQHEAEAAAIRQRIAPGGGLLAGILGRLHPGKGQSLLIEALPRLRARGLDITVVLMGEGPAEAEYRALADRLGVGAHVHFAGLVAETLPWLRAMDMVCVPSLKDSLPLTALEAMSVARPVIASRAGDLPLAITDGEHGLLVEVGSSAALEAAVEKLARSPARRAELGEAGRQRLIERYTPEAMLRQLEGYCAELIAERGHGR